MFKRPYPLKKSFSILRQAAACYSSLHFDPITRSKLKDILSSLQESILKKERHQADVLAKEVEAFLKLHNKKSLVKSLCEFILAMGVAFLIATLIRQTWFELYQIPTGSMRPTYRELDHLIVSKTAFGINAPFTTGSLYFDPSSVQRGGAVIFSSSGLDLLDTDSHYFWLFPYKKRFIKRMIGLPGDTLYFYGGQLYGIDREGNTLSELRTHHEMEKLEYIPFRNFLGEIKKKKATSPSFDSWATFSLAGNELGRGKVTAGLFFDPEIQFNKQWIQDTLEGRSYGQFYGINNYGMGRLLNQEQISRFYHIPPQEELYLEIRHHPSLTPSDQIVSSSSYGASLIPFAQTSLLPLTPKELETLWKNLYTTRFIIRNGFAYSYSYGSPSVNRGDAPSFPDVPDGTYEFYYGKGYRVEWGGILADLPKDHPLYAPHQLQKLFNLGIEFSTYFEPTAALQAFYPLRYVYFRQGDLFVMGEPLILKESSEMKIFLEAEKRKGKKGFTDAGEPSVEQIQQYGLKVPDYHYFVLGDNHAVSGDSRIFGFVPQENLEGVPTFLIWPFGQRWGWATHLSYPWITESNLFIWIIAALGGYIYWQWGRYRMSRKVFTT